MLTDQQHYNQKNADFWNELCGSNLAKFLGITEINAKTLQQFDKAYMDYYPYLAGYVMRETLKDRRVLEIGLGYGTLGSLIAVQGSDYYGIDVAMGPVKMIQYRLRLQDQKVPLKSIEGSALALPYESESFDYVYSIGCLHHTGNLSLAIAEVHRVLKPGGKAIVMLYNRYSFRQFVKVPLISLKHYLFMANKQKTVDERIRALYDENTMGDAVPYIDYVSCAQVRQLFRDFSQLHIDIQNFEGYGFLKGNITFRREWFLNNLARILGLDLYIMATK